jgi:hypothetical protein
MRLRRDASADGVDAVERRAAHRASLLRIRLLDGFRLGLVRLGVARARRRRSDDRRRRRDRSAGAPVANGASGDPTGGTVRSGAVCTPAAATAGSLGDARRSTWPTRMTLRFSMLFHAASSRTSMRCSFAIVRSVSPRLTV